MKQGTHSVPTWVRYVAVVLGYVVAYQLVRSVSISYWQLQVGLRLSFVLLLPRRYWPAVLIGDMIGAAPAAYQCLPQYGWPGALLHIFPVSAFAMLPVWLLRRHLPGPAFAKQAVEPVTASRMTLLLACALVLSLLTAADSTVQFILTLAQDAAEPERSPAVWACRYLLGAYLGCLTVVPLALAAWDAIRHANSWDELARNAARSRLLLEGTLIGLTAFGILTALGAGAAGDMWRGVARILMFAPAVWLAVRYSWQGAALGTTAISIGVMLTMPRRYDETTLLVLVSVAFVATLLLPFAAGIAVLNERERRSNIDRENAREVARRELYQAEQRLRWGIEAMTQVDESLLELFSRLLHRSRHFISDSEERYLRKQLALAKQQKHWLANSVHPVQWQKRGLTGAFWDGPVAQTLEDVNVAYEARVPEAVDRLSAGAQLTLYRVVCEAVAYLVTQQQGAQRIALSARMFMIGPGRATPWVVVTVEASTEQDSALSDVRSQALSVPSELITSKLGAMGLSIRDIGDRLSFYGGKVRVHRAHRRVTLSLRDIQAAA